MIELGKKQILTVIKKVDFGVYLADTAGTGGREAGEEKVLLPMKQVPEDTQLNDSLTVFVYRDCED